MSQAAAVSFTSVSTHIGFAAGHFSEPPGEFEWSIEAIWTTIHSIAGECSVMARGISTIGRSVLQDPDASSIGRESLIFLSRESGSKRMSNKFIICRINRLT
jgi:hypothetical protein